MEYEIKLSGTPLDNGAIDLDRLQLLTQSLQDIAKGSLLMHVFGTSVKKGQHSSQINHALKIRLRGMSEGSTILHLECQPFRETLSNEPENLLHQKILQYLSDQTPIGLVIKSFQDALDPENNGELLDKHLLKEMQNFKKVFANKDETLQFISISTSSIHSQGNLSDLKLNIADFSKLKQIEEKTAKSKLVIISGVVEELKFSKAKVIFVPDKGKPFAGFLGENVTPAEMATFWGQKATIRGIAHFKPNGQMAYVQINKVSLSTPSEACFSHTPSAETVAQQIQRQLRERKGFGNALKRYEGMFGDLEGSLEEDLKMLKG